eukprot:2718233-Amphidinium_carterae.1
MRSTRKHKCFTQPLHALQFAPRFISFLCKLAGFRHVLIFVNRAEESEMHHITGLSLRFRCCDTDSVTHLPQCPHLRRAACKRGPGKQRVGPTKACGGIKSGEDENGLVAIADKHDKVLEHQTKRQRKRTNIKHAYIRDTTKCINHVNAVLHYILFHSTNGDPNLA